MTYYRLSSKVKHICLIGNAAVVTTTSSRNIFPEAVTQLILECIYGKSEEDICSECPSDFKDEYMALIHQVLSSNTVSQILSPSDKPDTTAQCKIFGETGCYYPQQIIVELTNMCNLACSHCYKNAQVSGNSVFQSYTKLKSLLSFVGKNVPQIVLTGGEPLLHPQITEIIQALQPRDIIIKTNGTRLKHLPPCCMCNIRLFSISVYGLSDQEYLERTGNRNGFSALVSGLNYIVAHHATFELTVTLSKSKLGQMAQYADFAYCHGAKTLSFGRVNKEGRAADMTSDVMDWYLSSDEIRMAYIEIRKLGKQYAGKLDIVQWERPMIDQFVPKEIEIDDIKTLYCGAGLFHWTVTERFKFKPCVTMADNDFLLLTFDEWRDYVAGKTKLDWDMKIASLKQNILDSGRSLSEVCTRL